MWKGGPNYRLEVQAIHWPNSYDIKIWIGGKPLNNC